MPRLSHGATAATAGCASLGYYGQAVRGQLEILSARRPIPRVLEDPGVPAETKRRLERVAAMREFARTELGLDQGGSFRTYADLHRDYVVWNVFAAPEFSLAPLESCFPVVGCLGYRGFFRREHAEAWAATLRAAGNDVYVGGVAAYSTLGWFDDPVLNTWLGYDPPRLAGIVFHELAHGLVYAADDSEFNESFATAVAQIGYARWQAAQGMQDDGAAAQLQAREDGLIALLLGYRARFAALYASGEPPAALRAGKQRLFAALANDYAALKRGWNGDTRYDAWMSRDLNNAKLASVVAYHALVPAFRALHARCGAELPRFYARVRALAALPRETRAAALRDAAAGDCAAR
ncbi:MAG: aminopeptidase [Gammaproteobacteria bacterium]|nr:aminopeptidase [Gammaproteobacteria bacterium]